MEAVKKALNKRAGTHDLKLADQIQHSFAYNVPHAHTLEDCLRPEYWANEAKKMLLLDRVYLRAEDMSFYAEAIVVSRTDFSAKLKIVNHVQLNDEVNELLDTTSNDYLIQHRGLKGWSVIRKSDKTVLSEGKANRAEAEQSLVEYLKAVKK